MLDDTTGSQGFRTLDRRRLLRAGVWAAPRVVVAAAVPAASASPVNPVMGGAFSIFDGGLDGNVSARFESGSWTADNLVQITVTSAGGVLGTPTTEDLNGWQLLTQSATSTTLQYPIAPSGNYWTSPFLRWIPFTSAPAAGSISINGRISGTTANGFEGGPIVGPR